MASSLREDEPHSDSTMSTSPQKPARTVTVRRFSRDDSVFLDHDYLIKGVAGAILWRLLQQHVATGRIDFSTRELRLDRTLKVPDHAENLDARLVLLRRRLEERDTCLKIEKTGRGHFRLLVNCRVALEEVDSEASNVA